MTEKVKEILNGLTPVEKDALYRALWLEHVIEDVKDHAEDIDMDITEDQILNVANRYVYEGDYDCNQSYWDNLEHLMEDI